MGVFTPECVLATLEQALPAAARLKRRAQLARLLVGVQHQQRPHLTSVQEKFSEKNLTRLLVGGHSTSSDHTSARSQSYQALFDQRSCSRDAAVQTHAP